MKINIKTNNGIKQVNCYKTQYKNIVIAELKDIGGDGCCYSITHYPTGVALCSKRYIRKKDVMQELHEVIEQIKNTEYGKNIKKYCKKYGIERINF